MLNVLPSLALVSLWLASVAGNLLCSGDDPTCVEPLYDYQFFAEMNASSFYTDYIGASSEPIYVNGVRVAAQSLTNMPVVQLPQVDVVQLLVTVPSGGMAAPHYHYNAVELGYFTKGRQIFSCLLDSSIAVTYNATSAPIKFYCNKLNEGNSYTIPKGWLHWLLSPCDPFEVFLTFTSNDYGNVNVPKAVYQGIPVSKYYPGKNITVEEMQDLYQYLQDSVGSFEFGDNHLMPGNATAAAIFCEKYGSQVVPSEPQQPAESTMSSKQASTSGTQSIMSCFAAFFFYVVFSWIH